MGSRAATAGALATWTAAEAAAALHGGECTAHTLLKAATTRMGSTRQLNAFVGGVLSTASRDADASDERRRRGDTKAPGGSMLDGVPIAVKDNFCVRGAPTTAGSKMLKGYTPPMESTVTARLRAAGAVIVGKCNMDEFGMGSANVHSASGACINPWVARPTREDDKGHENTSSSEMEMTHEASLGPRVAGGSSGGSASAVAAGSAVLAVGSDTGGSVRLPAAYCGVVGFKPSYGHLSRWGLVPYVSSMDTPGFLARSVSDTAVAMYTCHGADPLDSTSVDVNTNKLLRWLETNDEVSKHLRGSTGDLSGADQRPPSFLRSRVGMPLAGWRVGVPIEYDVAEISDEVRVAWSETCELLERLGATVVKVSLPSTAAALAAYYIIAPAEASSNLARYDGVRYGIDGGSGSPSGESIEAARESIEVAGESLGMSGDDFHASVAKARAKGFGPEVQRRVLVGTYVLGTDITSRYFDKAQRVRRKVAEEFAGVFSGGGGGGAGGFGGGSDMFGLSAAGVGLATGVDLLLTPTAPTCAPLLYGPGGADVTSLADTGIEPATAGYAADAMTVPASLAGLPAASLPVGLGSSTGMPIGMQLIAPRGCDVELIGAAWHVERALADAGERGGGVGPLGEAGSEAGGGNGGGGLAIGWGRDHRAQGTVDAVRFSAMGDFV